jgi:adenine-specific DNA-methyltransferase
MGLEILGHKDREDRKTRGATYTPKSLAKAVASNLLQVRQEFPKERTLRILDPGAGDGALIKALLNALDPDLLRDATVTVVDISTPAVENMKRDLLSRFPQVTFHFLTQDFFQFYEDSRSKSRTFDVIIANPPYVRSQEMDASLRGHIKEAFSLAGRADLSFAFTLGISNLLAPDGIAAVITSNKLLTTSAGRSARDALEKSVDVAEVWDLGDTRLFDAAVLPCVLFIKGAVGSPSQETVFRSMYRSQAEVSSEAAMDASSAILKEGCWRLLDGSTVEVRCGCMSRDEGWRISERDDQKWADQVRSASWSTFGDIAHVRVGIKTTADKVFISKDWQMPRPELLQPLITHHVAGRFKPSKDAARSVIYPYFVENGRRTAVDLESYPNTQAHFESHRQRLEGREYLKKSGREWFEIWVPHHPDDWSGIKVVFRDIAERPTFWMDATGSVVNGDCYWIKVRPGVDEDILWLMLAVANSSLTQKYYDVVLGERLYAGRRRFMTRHVCKFPLPDPELEASIEAAAVAKRLAEEDVTDVDRAGLEARLDALITLAFGL